MMQSDESKQEVSSSDVQPEYGDRYQELVEKLLLNGLCVEETQEMERLGTQMDTRSAPFHKVALQRMKIIASVQYISGE